MTESAQSSLSSHSLIPEQTSLKISRNEAHARIDKADARETTEITK